MERRLGDKVGLRLPNITRKKAEQQQQQQQQQHGKPPSPPSLKVQLKLGWDQANRTSVALKTFRTDPYIFDDHPSRQLVEYEIKSMDRVSSHNNIVRLHNVVVVSPSKFCLVMEAAAGSRGNLMETIAAAPDGR